MKNRILSVVISLLLGNASFLNAEIIEVAHFQEITSHIQSDTLVLLDIDDTLLIPVQMLGCDEWFMSRLQFHQKSIENGSQALEKSLAEWESIRHITQMELVEPTTNALIEALQAQGYCIMGLTTQGLSLATRTVLQLKEQQIDLLLTAPSQDDYFLPISHHGVLYRRGILFTSGTQKGKALFQLLDTLGYTPKRIVFINDKTTHLAEIELIAKTRGVEFTGLRYAYSDARKAKFSPALAEIQFNHSSFGHILSDKEAMALLYRK